MILFVQLFSRKADFFLLFGKSLLVRQTYCVKYKKYPTRRTSSIHEVKVRYVRVSQSHDTSLLVFFFVFFFVEISTHGDRSSQIAST